MTNRTTDVATDITMRDPRRVFQDAIDSGVLTNSSVDGEPKPESYVSRWMYMYTRNGNDYFKNINTRKYITSPVPNASED